MVDHALLLDQRAEWHRRVLAQRERAGGNPDSGTSRWQPSWPGFLYETFLVVQLSHLIAPWRQEKGHRERRRDGDWFFSARTVISGKIS